MTWTFQWALWIVLLAPGIAAATQENGAVEEQTAPAETDIPQVKDEPLKELPPADQEDKTDDEMMPPPKDLPQSTAETPPTCSADAWAATAPCAPRLVVGADYLLWWIRRGPTPPLLTTGPPDGTGVIGDPTTRILYGQNGIDYGTFSGVRLQAGWSFGEDRFWGLEASGFWLDPHATHFAAASDATGNPLLVRPFFSTSEVQEAGVFVAYPGGLQGAIHIDSNTRFWGFDANLVAHSIRDTNRSFDLLCGFRCLGLDENLTIGENLTLLQDGGSLFQIPPVGMVGSIMFPPQGSTISTLDVFQTQNRFYGGQVGGRFEWSWGRLSLDLTGKLALGVTQQNVSIFGLSKLDQPVTQQLDPVTVTPGGVLALVSNIGNYQRYRFGVVPELGLNAQVDITSHLRARIGYSGVYWSSVARPGAQIDPFVNPKLIPTGQGFITNFDPTVEQARPHFQFLDNGFWAQGLDFGIELRF